MLEFVEGPKISMTDIKSAEREFTFRKVEFTEQDLGIEFGVSVDNAGLVACDFMEGESGVVLAAAKSGLVNIGDLLSHVNGEYVLGLDNCDGGKYAIEMLGAYASQRPLSLSFIDSYSFKVQISKPQSIPGIDYGGGPSELVLNERQIDGVRRVYIEDFRDANGMAENSGIFISDHLVFVNGLPVGAGCRCFRSPG